MLRTLNFDGQVTMTTAALLPLALFVILLLDLALLGLAVSGHFPRRPASDQIPAIDLYGAIAVGTLTLVVGVAAAIKLVPWYALVIGGGLSVLCAPLLLQRFSDRFVDGRAALMVFSALAMALTLTLVFLGGGAAL
jgi:hypothetical protein